MLINEASLTADLTKKAIQYYCECGLVFPEVLENGYRDFNENDIERLKKISVYRKLGINTHQIKELIDDETNNSLQKLIVEKKLSIEREQTKKSILNKLNCGAKLSEIKEDLKIIEDKATVTQKLLEAFPGYYGRFICLHFARFLNEPIKTDKQKAAYQKIISFLDEMPTLNLPKDLQDYLIENTKNIGSEQITDLIQTTKKLIENPDEFLFENEEIIEQYLNFKQSDEYKNSPIFKINDSLKEFNKTSGYNEIFIPALKDLSLSYARYYKQLELANEKLILKYPDISKILDK